jgi:hypothetical protein
MGRMGCMVRKLTFFPGHGQSRQKMLLVAGWLIAGIKNRGRERREFGFEPRCGPNLNFGRTSTWVEPRLGNGGGEAEIRVDQTESDRIKPMQYWQGNVQASSA